MTRSSSSDAAEPAPPVSYWSDPIRRATIADVLRRRGLRDANRPAVVVNGDGAPRTALSYSELDRLACRMAHVLRDTGVVRGDVVAMMASNGIDHIVTYFGALKLGAAFTSVNPTLTVEEAAYQLGNALPRVVVHEKGVRDVVTAACASFSVELIESEGSDDSIRPDSPLGIGLAAADPNEPAADVAETDLAMIVYTSGTESLPKGVRIPHRNFLIATSPAWITEGYVVQDDRFLLLAPMYTMAGIGTVTNLVAAGSCIVLPAAKDLRELVTTIERERITNMSQTPTFYAKLIDENALGHADLTSLRQCHTYGGSIPRRVIEAFSELAPQVTWATYWGQTELTQLGSIGFYRTLADIPDGDPRWIGKAVPQIEVCVVDDDGKQADIGELLCRSPALMEGYHKAPELTAAAIRDGWLHTGDVVRRDSDSNLFFYDRKKDVIKTGGMNVSSLEVETALVDHPSARAAAVVGIPDDYWSEIVTAFVVPNVGCDTPEDAAALIEHARSRLAPYKVPKQVVFVSSLPWDRQGKVSKRELRRTQTAGDNPGQSM